MPLAGNQTRAPAPLRHTRALTVLQATQRSPKGFAVAWSCANSNDRNEHASGSIGEVRGSGIGGTPETTLGRFKATDQLIALLKGATFMLIVYRVGVDFMGEAFEENLRVNYWA